MSGLAPGFSQRARETPPASERVKILLVDDKADHRLPVEAALESLGEEVVTAQSGPAALNYLLDHDVAVVLLDVLMPGMDGFETASRIRQRECSRHTPIIFLMAPGPSEEHVFRGYGFGAADYLQKPIVPEVLRSKVSVFADLSRVTNRWKHQAQLLERRVKELDLLNRELEAFSYSVSHDLRAPLSRIAGFSRALTESYAGKLDDTGRIYLERVRASAERMGQLVDDLLNFSHVTRVQMRREVVDLSELVRGIAAELRGRDDQCRAEFVVEDGVEASGDANLLRAALLNLLENASKFTRKQARARIEFGARDQGGATVYFVRDNGAGFDPALAHKLFNPFQRLHGSSEFEGHGIGLATADRIIRRHGGRIWAEGTVGRGATFYFTLQAMEQA